MNKLNANKHLKNHSKTAETPNCKKTHIFHVVPPALIDFLPKIKILAFHNASRFRLPFASSFPQNPA